MWELEDMAIKVTQNETHREEKKQQKNDLMLCLSLFCATTEY